MQMIISQVDEWHESNLSQLPAQDLSISSFTRILQNIPAALELEYFYPIEKQVYKSETQPAISGVGLKIRRGL